MNKIELQKHLKIGDLVNCYIIGTKTKETIVRTIKKITPCVHQEESGESFCNYCIGEICFEDSDQDYHGCIHYEEEDKYNDGYLIKNIKNDFIKEEDFKI